MANEKILVVDDESAVVDLLKDWLEDAGHEVITASDGSEGFKQFFNHRPDLAIIDILMPVSDGFELCQRIREVSQIPIIVLSARGQESYKVRGLHLGADDYLVKPIGGKELLARVSAALRRSKLPPSEAASSYSDGVVSLDFKQHEAYVRGERVSLTPTEYRLLSYLVQHRGQVVTQQQLWDSVWGWDAGSLDSVKWHISYLRKKIEENPEDPKLVVTVRGVGYRYQAPSTQRD
ncbi:MAG: response regulator transcription factor [Dehalococcoidia bacterium]|nr:response regulator transcription factor [Dehalococcoidia bacterium]